MKRNTFVVSLMAIAGSTAVPINLATPLSRRNIDPILGNHKFDLPGGQPIYMRSGDNVQFTFSLELPTNLESISKTKIHVITFNAKKPYVIPAFKDKTMYQIIDYLDKSGALFT